MTSASLDLADVPGELRPAAMAALRAAGVLEGHLSVELVAPDRIRELNREHRGLDEPTDVLSLPDRRRRGGSPARASSATS